MSERRFPIMSGPSVPWRMVEPYARQAYENHGQTLERLAERGGLDPTELWCAVHSKRLRDAPVNADDWLRAWLDADIERLTADLIATWFESPDAYHADGPGRIIRSRIAADIRAGKWKP